MKKIVSLVIMLLVAATVWALPFVPTTSPSTKPIHWYQLKVNNKYVYASPNNDSDLAVSSSSSTADAYLWCFVGTSSSGYKIYNRKTKSYLYSGYWLGSAYESSVDYYEAGSGDNFYIYAIFEIFGTSSTIKNYLCYNNTNGFYTTAGKDSYFNVTEVMVENEPVYTDVPNIDMEVNDESCVITATGVGTVKLYIDNVNVSNPFTIARTQEDRVITAVATAQESGKEMSSLTKYFTIPRLDSDVIGDVNGDGVVDISDVNAVINMMLGKMTPTAAGDVTGDSHVDISDVNIIINLMLGKNTTPTTEPTVHPVTAYGYSTPGNTNNRPDEAYTKLVDGNKYTKWCVINESGTWQPIYIDIQSETKFVPTSYILTTGNDTHSYTGRNPKKWKLYGKVNESDSWTVLANVTDGAAAGLGTSNITEYSFALQNITKAYKYYRFEVIELCGKDGWNSNNYVFQMAELQLLGR
ncbi:MAG: hypothetical protein IKX39_03525 [Muribaculaceae bacterium]|nr:hypothetical protein [Muribaculaceae bacterium]MBR5727697.1 hypothetical protein [Muribaculaceae bacterium]